MKTNTRPTVQKTLQMIGFIPQTGISDENAIAAWDELSNWKPVTHKFASDVNQNRHTHFVSVPLEPIVDESGEHYCQIDKSLHYLIETMQLADESKEFFAPLASVNFGNSSMFGGCVVFHMIRVIDNAKATSTMMNLSKDHVGR